MVSGYGGVFKAMNVEADTMSAAKQASKMAVDIFEDESLQGDNTRRKERNTPLHVPTFFTGVPQSEPHPVAAAHADRFQRDANVSISFQNAFLGNFRQTNRFIYEVCSTAKLNEVLLCPGWGHLNVF